MIPVKAFNMVDLPLPFAPERAALVFPFIVKDMSFNISLSPKARVSSWTCRFFILISLVSIGEDFFYRKME